MVLASHLKPVPAVQGSVRSSFHGVTQALQNLSIAARPDSRPLRLAVEGTCGMWSCGSLTNDWQLVPFTPPRYCQSHISPTASRVCDLTGKKANNGYNVTFSHKRNKKLQHANLQHKRVYWPEAQRYVRLRLCTKVRLGTRACILGVCKFVAHQAIKTLEKKGLQAMAKEAGLDLWKLPFQDARPERLEWVAAQPKRPPMAKNPRKMKNPEKIAASKKTPLIGEYVVGNRIAYRRAEQGEF